MSTLVRQEEPEKYSSTYEIVIFSRAIISALPQNRPEISSDGSSTNDSFACYVLRIIEPTQEHPVFIILITHLITKDFTLRRQQKPIHDFKTFVILRFVGIALLSFIACDAKTIRSV